MTHENDLWPQDETLFSHIEKEGISPSEKHFLQKMRTKLLDENAPWPETLVWEHDNPDHLYLLRQGYDEFMLGKGTCREEWQESEIHTMNLSEVLAVNLKEAGLLDRDLSLLEWLQEQNFSCVRYNHENDGNKVG